MLIFPSKIWISLEKLPSLWKHYFIDYINFINFKRLLQRKWNSNVTKGRKNRRTRTYHLHSIERVLRGDRCASETLQGVCISKGSWIAAWNVRATYLTAISAEKKKSNGCVSRRTDAKWREIRWSWKWHPWIILNRFRSPRFNILSRVIIFTNKYHIIVRYSQKKKFINHSYYFYIINTRIIVFN